MANMISLALVLVIAATGLTFPGEASVQNPMNYHIRLSLRSDLNLTPVELKVFSGHALNMIKSKCPKVDADKIFGIQKFISKALAPSVEETKGAKSNNPRFTALVEAFAHCSKDVETQPKVHFTALRPLTTVITIKEDSGEPQLDFMDADVAAPRSMGENMEAKKIEKAPTAASISHSSSSHGLVALLEELRKFFFETVPKAFGRKRRSVEGEALPLVVDLAFEKITPSKVIEKTTAGESLKPTTTVPKSFHNVQRLIDQICRIYCRRCNPMQIRNMRMASRELLGSLTKDENTAIALASLANDDVLKTIEACDSQPLFPFFSFIRR